jgi:hypothetical protein
MRQTTKLLALEATYRARHNLRKQGRSAMPISRMTAIDAAPDRIHTPDLC